MTQKFDYINSYTLTNSDGHRESAAFKIEHFVPKVTYKLQDLSYCDYLLAISPIVVIGLLTYKIIK